MRPCRLRRQPEISRGRVRPWLLLSTPLDVFLSSLLFLINGEKLTCQLSHEGVVRINEIIFFKYSEIP